MDEYHGGCRVERAEFKNGEVHTTLRSWEIVDVEVLPKALDWRNKDGINYVSYNKNELSPHYCGSCWAQGPTSAIADRFNILNARLKKEHTLVGLSAQVLINCQAGGSCNGGDPSGVYEFAHTNGIPHSSCI